MTTTVELDEAILSRAREISGVGEDRVLVETALTALIQREASRRLAELGGTMPDLEYVPRRRPGSGDDRR